MKPIKSNSNSVSEVVGTILLLAIAVSLFSVSCIFFLPREPNTSSISNTPYLAGYMEKDTIFLEHKGGDSLPFNTIIKIDDYDIIAEDYFDISDSDNSWDVGERVKYCLNSYDYSPIQVTVIDVKSESIIWNGVLQSENNAPIAVDDGPITVESGGTAVIDILGNDYDDYLIDPSTVEVTTDLNELHGSIYINADNGEVTYTSDEGYDGQDPFNYRVSDFDGFQSDEATVLLVVDNNLPPDIPYDPSPLNGEIDVGTNPTLSVTVSDSEGDTMDVSFYDASDNDLIGTVTDVSSGNTASIEWISLDGSTTYSWYAIANDGVSYSDSSDIWSFTTQIVVEELWEKFFGDGIAYSIATDSNNNVYVAGYGENLVSSESGYDWWIKKYNSDGVEDTVNWNKMFDGGGEDCIRSITIDSAGDVYVAGYGENLVNSYSDYDWWIKKFNSDGDEYSNWNKKINGGKDDKAYSITTDSNDYVYVAGYGNDLLWSSSNRDWWIKKFSPDGTEITYKWNKKITGSTADFAYSVTTDSADNVYVAGYGYDLVSSTSCYDWWIKKFNSDGDEYSYWNKKIDSGFSDYAYDWAYSVTVDSSDNVYVVGCGNKLISSSSRDDWWIKKYNSDGVEYTDNWNKMFDGGSYKSDKAYSVTTNSNDDVYVAGYKSKSNEDWWIKKFNSDGEEDTLNWPKEFTKGNDDYAWSITTDSNDDVCVAGQGDSNNWWIKKFSSS